MVQHLVWLLSRFAETIPHCTCPPGKFLPFFIMQAFSPHVLFFVVLVVTSTLLELSKKISRVTIRKIITKLLYFRFADDCLACFFFSSFFFSVASSLLEIIGNLLIYCHDSRECHVLFCPDFVPHYFRSLRTALGNPNPVCAVGGGQPRRVLCSLSKGAVRTDVTDGVHRLSGVQPVIKPRKRR